MHRARSTQLSAQVNFTVLGSGVFSESLQPDVLPLLHKAHLLINKMNAVAKYHAWWAHFDQDITAKARAFFVSKGTQ